MLRQPSRCAFKGLIIASSRRQLDSQRCAIYFKRSVGIGHCGNEPRWKFLNAQIPQSAFHFLQSTVSLVSKSIMKKFIRLAVFTQCEPLFNDFKKNITS